MRNERVRRLESYVEGFALAHGMEQFPTVREAARALKLPQSEIELIAGESEHLDLYSYPSRSRTRLGDKTLQGWTPGIEAWWRAYDAQLGIARTPLQEGVRPALT